MEEYFFEKREMEKMLVTSIFSFPHKVFPKAFFPELVKVSIMRQGVKEGGKAKSCSRCIILLISEAIDKFLYDSFCH